MKSTITLSKAEPAQSPSPYGGYTSGDRVTFEKHIDGWYYCFHGISADGNAYDGDDVGPFPSRKEAARDAREHLCEVNPDQAQALDCLTQ